MDLLDSDRGLHLQYGEYPVEAGLDSPLIDQISKELASYSKSTLLRIELYIEISETESFPQILHIVGVIETLHKHVDIHLHFVPDQLLENFINHSLESGSFVLQAEGHDFVAVDGAAGGEGRLVLVFWMHPNLIVFLVDIHEAEKFVTCCHIDHLVYAG